MTDNDKHTDDTPRDDEPLPGSFLHRSDPGAIADELRYIADCIESRSVMVESSNARIRSSNHEPANVSIELDCYIAGTPEPRGEQ